MKASNKIIKFLAVMMIVAIASGLCGCSVKLPFMQKDTRTVQEYQAPDPRHKPTQSKTAEQSLRCLSVCIEFNRKMSIFSHPAKPDISYSTDVEYIMCEAHIIFAKGKYIINGFLLL